MKIIFTADIHMKNPSWYESPAEADVYLDSGDWYGKKTIPDAPTYSALCIGNHDSPLKYDKLIAVPNIIATNYIFKDTGESPFRPFKYIIGDKKVMVMAVGMGSISSKRKIRKLTKNELYSTIQALMDNTDSDARILLLHGGEAEAKKITQNTKGLDFILCGHTHKVVNKVINGVKVAQAGKWLEHYGVIDTDTMEVSIHKL